MSAVGTRRLSAYRIVTRKFVASAFSGAGARLYGGRWNSVGVPVIYTSSTIALALLEWRAHLTQWPAPPVFIIEIQFDSSLIFSPGRLPKGWMRTPAPPTNALLGDKWVKSGNSAILKLPSTIVPDEYNYLLNPNHPDSSKIRIGKPRLLKLDPRLGPLASLPWS
jgi:RES domain-containing protein